MNQGSRQWAAGSRQGARERRRLLGRCLLLLLLAAPGADAARWQDGELALDLEYGKIRSNAPVRVRAKFERAGSALLEGWLELVIKSGREVLVTYRSPELALTAGQQSFDMLLPALAVESYDSYVDVHARFLTKGKEFKFGTTQWLVPRELERSCVIGVSYPRLEWDEKHGVIMRSMGLERFQPPLNRPGRRALFTTAVRLPPDDLPAHPLGYCSFDVLLLAGKGFTFLRERKLAAIQRWVEAGGSLCIVPSGSLHPRHVQFLNGLAGRARPVFSLEPFGTLRAGPEGRVQAAGQGAAYTFHTGLGRTAVLLDPATDPEGLKSPEWRRTMVFLWKIRGEQVPSVVREGKWRNDLEREPTSSRGDYREPSYEREELESRLHVLPVCELKQILGGLMPSEVRLIPFPVIVLMLVLFVVAIGPLDYYLLGRLRRRRLTWLLFPLTAAGFAFFTVRLSEYYMGRQDHRRSLVFVDVDRKGRPVRQSRYEFIFAATEHTARYALKNCLFYPMGSADPSMLARGEPSLSPVGPRYGSRGVRPGASSPLRYEGRVPSLFAATQVIRQWTPQLNKAFSLDPPQHMPQLDWDAVSIRDFESARLRISGKLYRGRRVEGSVEVLNGYKRFSVSGRGGSRVSRFLTARSYGRSLLEQASVRPQMGLFSIVSQISPTGAPNFEDLSVLDPTDLKQWLLVVIEEVGDDVFIYRRLYRGEG